MLRIGSMTVLRPARAAATTFSLMPPTGRTRPRRLISPVIAVSLRTGRSVSSEASAMNIATPALGPSFGMAPAGTWMWMSLFSNQPWVEPERHRLRLDQAQRGLRRLLHDIAELAGEDQLALAGDSRRLDEQDVAAGRRPGEPGGDARHAGPQRDLTFEAPGAEDVRDVGGVDRTGVGSPSAIRTAARRKRAPMFRAPGCGIRPPACSRG